MMRNVFSAVLVSVVMLELGPQARAGVPKTTGSAQAENSSKLTLREKVLEIPPQTMVEVRLKNKEKARGRLGEVSNDGFVVKVASGQTIGDRKIAFDDVKSMRKFDGNKALRVAGYSALATGVAVGTVIIILVIVAAAAS